MPSRTSKTAAAKKSGRTAKTPEQRAQEALALAERHVARLQKKHAGLTEQQAAAKGELDAASARLD